MTNPKTAFLFPGQGSQTPGMGHDLAHHSPAAKAVLAAVDTALGDTPPLSHHMAEGPAATLTLTTNAQPALMATSLAAVRALEHATQKPLASLGDYVAGHSLGEYSALTAAGVFDVATAARLLRTRGDAMQNAVPTGQGAMAVLLGAEIDAIESFIANLPQDKANPKTDTIEIANDNSPGQIVISGEATAIQTAIDLASKTPDLGVKRAMLLPVSAPFHCRHMAPAADVMAEALAATTLNIPSMPIFTNVSAAPQTDPAVIRRQLVDQVVSRVRWRETLLALAEAGTRRFIELGTGKVLSGLVKRTLPDAEIYNIDKGEDVAAVTKLLA